MFIEMKRIIWLGDSTVTYNKISTYPQTGLSQGLLWYLKDDVFLRSFAINGRSTKSFIEQGRLDEADSYIEAGDLVFITFAHNDEKKEDTLRYTDPDTTFKENLKRMIAVAKKHGAYPVLFTPIARRLFDAEGNFLPGSHGVYPEKIREVAAEEDLPLVDLTAATESYLTSVGDFASRPLYVFPKDNSHLQMQGAVTYAGFIAEALASFGSPYSDVLAARDAKGTDEDGKALHGTYVGATAGKAGADSSGMDESLQKAAFSAEPED